MQFPLPQKTVRVLSKLEDCGFEAYVVGGCVRDYILGLTPHEFDICSSAKPQEVHACFEGSKLLDTGLKHGTVTLLSEGDSFEITTFRSDGSYSDQRHPDEVRFSTSIREDLKRRDFTVNAMAYSPMRGFVDPFHGVQACHDKLLIAVGDPQKRFEEDALRILRAMRFASKLGFTIKPSTQSAMLQHASNLKKISRERIGSELNQILMGQGAANVLRLYPQILFAVLPQLAPMLKTPQKTRYHMYDLWEHTMRVIEFTPSELSLRWAALLHDSGKPASMTFGTGGVTHFRGHPLISTKLSDDCLSSLRQPKALQQDVHTLVLHHDDRFGPEKLHRWLSRLGIDLLKRLLILQYADIAAHAPDIAAKAHKTLDLIPMAEALIEQGACLGLSDLKVNGNMLIQAGVQQGPALGTMLNYLLDLVLSGDAENDQDMLMNLATQRLREL